MQKKLFIIAFLVLNFPLLAKETKEVKETKEEDKIKIGGLLEAGFDVNYKLNKDETNYKKIGLGKIDISARPVKNIRAEFGLEYDNRDSSFIIDKLYGQYGFSDFSLVRAGYTKKAFGLEEKVGIGERYFHKRSIINDNLENFGLLGHDLTLQYRYSPNKEWKVIGGFSWSEDTLRYHQNYSVEYETKNNHVVASAVIGHYTHPDENLTAYATAISYKRSKKLFVSEVELTYGNNPAIKFIEGRDAFIFGLRMQEYFPIKIQTKTLRQIIPIAEAAVYSEDTDSGNYETQLRTGLTLGFARKSAFQWRNNYGIILRTIDGEKELRRKRFDSEVVVIF